MKNEWTGRRICFNDFLHFLGCFHSLAAVNRKEMNKDMIISTTQMSMKELFAVFYANSFSDYAGSYSSSMKGDKQFFH